MFGEVLFLDLDGDRNLHNNNSPNSPFFLCASVVCVWCACPCMWTFSGCALLCEAEEKVNRDPLSTHSRLLSANTRQLLKSKGFNELVLRS